MADRLKMIGGLSDEEVFADIRGHRVRRTEKVSVGSVPRNIGLRDSGTSPYRTARRIRRESEAIFRN